MHLFSKELNRRHLSGKFYAHKIEILESCYLSAVSRDNTISPFPLKLKWQKHMILYGSVLIAWQL